MLLELVAAVMLAVLVLWLILDPFARPTTLSAAPIEPDELEETDKGIALLALKEIDFDRATGKLSDEDHALLKRKYSAEAIAAMRAEESEWASDPDEAVERLVASRVAMIRGERVGVPLICPLCGPRPEPDARFCSTCGMALYSTEAACAACRAPLDPDSRFCGTCGAPVASV